MDPPRVDPRCHRDAEQARRFTEPHGSQQRPLGIVLVGDGGPEDGEDRVPEKPVYAAFMEGEGAHEGAQELIVRNGGPSGGCGHAGEYDRDDPVLSVIGHHERLPLVEA